MKIARRIVTGLVLAILLAAVAAGFQLYRAGYRAYIVHTGSMTGTYDSGDLIIDKPITGPLRVGEVITFYHSGLSSDVVTHRVYSLKHGTIQTKGDANNTPDTWNIRHDQVVGAVTASLPKMGYVAYFLKQPAGDAAVVTGLLAVLLLWGLFFPSASRQLDGAATGPVASARSAVRRRLSRSADRAAIGPHRCTEGAVRAATSGLPRGVHRNGNPYAVSPFRRDRTAALS